MNIQILRNIGFSEGEIKVYQAVVNIGSSSLNGIQTKTGIDRRNIYDILNKLIEKGLISYTIEKNKKTYQITHPNKIINFLEEKQQKIEENKEAVSKMLPDLIEKFNDKKESIKAEVYRGNDSIKALLNEMLEYKKSYWIGGNSDIETKTNLAMRNWYKHWMKERIAKKHTLYDLADYGTHLEEIKNTTEKMLYYEHKWLPKNMNSPMMIGIFGNKVVQILWSNQPFAFVLESKEIKDSYMKYFKYFWNK